MTLWGRVAASDRFTWGNKGRNLAPFHLFARGGKSTARCRYCDAWTCAMRWFGLKFTTPGCGSIRPLFVAKRANGFKRRGSSIYRRRHRTRRRQRRQAAAARARGRRGRRGVGDADEPVASFHFVLEIFELIVADLRGKTGVGRRYTSDRSGLSAAHGLLLQRTKL